jgi:cbb3-type cytochrome oxidase subunit 3
MTLSAIISDIISAFVMIMLIGIGWWAFAPALKKRFDDDAVMALVDDDGVIRREMKEEHAQ